jgi:hypothetical protein
MTFDYTGTIHFIKEKQEVSSKFSKQEFVVYTRTKKKNFIIINTVTFQTINDMCNMLIDLEIGDRVSIKFRLDGRRWKNKNGVEMFFNSLNAIQVFKEGVNRRYLDDRSKGRLWERYAVDEDERFNEDESPETEESTEQNFEVSTQNS